MIKKALTDERHLLPGLEYSIPDYRDARGRVGIKISEDYCTTLEGQILTWTLSNLLARLKNIVKHIILVIPQNVEVLEKLTLPRISEDGSLCTSIALSTRLIARGCDVTTSTNDDFENSLDTVVLVGPHTTTSINHTFITRAFASGWLSFNGHSDWMPDISSSNNNSNPFGALFSSCIAAGDVFKFLGGLKTDKGRYASDLCFSSYSFNKVDYNKPEQLKTNNPEFPENIDIGRNILVGCGAVAHGFCQALLLSEKLSGELTLIDRKVDVNRKNESIDETNLNRYILASSLDIGKKKASLLTEILSENVPGLRVTSYDEGFEAYINSGQNATVKSVLSCVDNNYARHAIQEQFPKVILGASTYEMSTQLSVYSLSYGTQCLKCYNEKQTPSETDRSIIDRLRNLPNDVRREEAIEVGVDPDRLEEYLSDPACGVLGEESIQKFSSHSPHDAQWAVSFVSAFSGFALASELVKDRAGMNKVLDRVSHTDFYYSFFYDSEYLTITSPNPQCWCNIKEPSARKAYAKIWGSD